MENKKGEEVFAQESLKFGLKLSARAHCLPTFNIFYFNLWITRAINSLKSWNIVILPKISYDLGLF